MGGCLASNASTKNALICFYGATKYGLTSNTTADKLVLNAMIPKSLPVANWLTTTAVTGATDIIVGKWYVIYTGRNCVNPALHASVPNADCSTGLAWANTNVLSAKWFQPKEISTKIYPGLPRFSAKETATWTAITTTGKKAAGGCTGKALTGASALVAGAAVAFGAAALAF